MKVLTQEEKDAHYKATIKGGAIGGVLGLTAGGGGVYLAAKRFPAFSGLTVPFRAFAAVSLGTFSSK
jgi:outer membrane lipoprotein SlyB